MQLLPLIKKALWVADGDCYRDSQSVKVQRTVGAGRITPLRHGSENAVMKSQQCGCLSNTGITNLLVDIPMWTGDIPHDLTPR